MKFKNIIKVDPNKITALAKKEASLSYYEALTAMIFLSSSYYNKFVFLITDLRQDVLKGNNNYPRNLTSAYDMITRFELADPRHHRIERTGDKGNRENHEGRGGRDHTFAHHTAQSGKVFITGLDGHTSYRIRCFNCEKWVHYDN